MIGKPYAGELQLRFDEGEQDFVLRSILNRHEAGNGAPGQGLNLRIVDVPILCSTSDFSRRW